MEFKIVKIDNTDIAEIQSDEPIIHQPEDILDLLGNCWHQGLNNIIINEDIITPEFFNLKTGIAGEILQKFSTYRMNLAIIGDFSKYSSNSLRDFISESNKTGRICFVNSKENAISRLSYNG